MPVTIAMGTEKGTKTLYGAVAPGPCHAFSIDLEHKQLVSVRRSLLLAHCGSELLLFF